MPQPERVKRNLRLPPELWDRLGAQAEARLLSTNRLVELALEQSVTHMEQSPHGPLR